MSDVVILCYHAVSSGWSAPLAVTPENLEGQLRLLIKRGFKGVTLEDAVKVTPKSGRWVVVTFDDAYRSVLTRGFPILESLGLPATVFAPTAWIGTGRPMVWPGIEHWVDTPYESELLPLSWEELHTLAQAGWEIGSHTHSHPRLTQLSDTALSHELQVSRDICEARLGRACSAVAYPYGAVDARVAAAAEALGYRRGVGLGHALRNEGPLRQPRIGIYNADNRPRFLLKASAPVRLLRSSRVWPT